MATSFDEIFGTNTNTETGEVKLTPSKTLADCLPQLSEPFPVEEVEFLPRASQLFAFVDYQKYKDRLNRILPGQWSEGQPVITMTDSKVTVSVVVYVLGVPYGGVGEEAASDDNATTKAYSQAFRRACASFGMGRYMYNFGRLYGSKDDDWLSKAIEAYRKAGIPVDSKYDNYSTPATTPTPPRGAAAPSSPPAQRPPVSADGKVGYASAKQAGKLRYVGFDDTEVARMSLQQMKRAVELAFANYDAAQIRNDIGLAS